MDKREDYPAGAPCWVDTLQPDPRAALRFYGSRLGTKLRRFCDGTKFRYVFY